VIARDEHDRSLGAGRRDAEGIALSLHDEGRDGHGVELG
jgi:hypothetical protein